jgi:hypothetical protein
MTRSFYLFGGKNVRPLDITMDDTLLMQIYQSFQNLQFSDVHMST